VLGYAVTTAEAGRHSGAHRHARVHAVLGTEEGANGAKRVRRAKTPKQGIVVAVLSCRGARSGGAVATERRRVWSSREGGLRPTGRSAIGIAGPRGAHRGLGSTG
jgi:hypothetical protein